MCGIVGYIGADNASSILLKGLRNLEYRGYDSLRHGPISGSLRICKGAGKIDLAIATMDLGQLEGSTGIAQTSDGLTARSQG